MRILHVLDHSIPLHSGYTFRTAALLREQRALGWETFHVTSPKQGASDAAIESVDGIEFHRTEPSASRIATLPVIGHWHLMHHLTQRLEQVARKVRPDLIHAHSPVLNAFPALNVGRKMGIPVVYEVRAFWEDAAVDHGTTREGSIRYRLTRALETRAMHSVDHVFTICNGLRDDIVSRGIPAANVTIVPNAVDLDSFVPARPPDAALQERLGLRGRTVIGFVGSFYAYEGLDLLVEAMPEIIAANPDIRLLLVGGGPQEAHLRARVAALALSSHVVFAGRVPHRDVQHYYDLIDVLAYPRHSMRLTELVTPLKPLEAMAQGQLFVASDVGGHRELVVHKKNGILFKADDQLALVEAIANLLNNKQIWAELRRNGRQYVESFRTWRLSAANYVPIYESLSV